MSIVQRNAQLTASLQITGLEQLVEHGVIGRVTIAVDVLTLPLAVRTRCLVAQTVAEVGLRVGAVEGVRVHLHVSIELLEGIGRARIPTEEDRCRQVAQLGFNADLAPPLLDQRLEVLTDGVGGGLVQD